ncbi:MAG: alpha/beta fold hydrolase [Thalassovita sp.]
MQEPLVFLPGMMCDARLFAPQLIDLGRDHVVSVAPLTGGDRIEDIASAILPALPDRFALAGLSMGGVVAMELMRKAPERITRLALMDTNALAETPAGAASLEPLIIGAKAGKLDEAVRQLVLPEHLGPGPSRLSVLAELQLMAQTLGPEVFVNQARALQRRRDQQATLRKVKCPTLVMCGEHDGLTPIKRHAFMAELIPYAALEVIEGAGHLPTLEQPTKVNDALRRWMNQPQVQRS